MMDLQFKPRLNTLDLELPQYPWTYRSAGVGGTAVAASGVPESYVIRTDRILTVRVRLLEHEVNDFLAEAEAVRASGASFPYRFEQSDALTEVTAYWHDPAFPESLEVERDPEFPGLFLCTFQIRTATAGAPFTIPFYETAP